MGAQLLGFGPVSVSGLRDAFARPARSVLTAVALAVAVVAVLVSLAVDRTVDGVLARPALAGDPEEIRVYPRDVEPSAVEEALTATAGVGSWFTETPQNLVFRDERFLGIAMGGDLGAAGYVGFHAGWNISFNKRCAMLKASWVFGIMNCIFFFFTFVSSPLPSTWIPKSHTNASR